MTDDATKTEDRFELYDLSVDVGEKTNLSIKRHEVTHRLANSLAKWLERTTPKERAE